MHNIASVSINIPIKKNGIATGGYFSSSDILKPPINNIIPTMAPIIDIIIFIPLLDFLTCPKDVRCLCKECNISKRMTHIYIYVHYRLLNLCIQKD